MAARAGHPTRRAGIGARGKPRRAPPIAPSIGGSRAERFVIDARKRAPAIIQHAVWLYLRFTLSYRDVEGLLAKRGLDISMKRSAVGC